MSTKIGLTYFVSVTYYLMTHYPVSYHLMTHHYRIAYHLFLLPASTSYIIVSFLHNHTGPSFFNLKFAVDNHLKASDRLPRKEHWAGYQ